MALRGAPVESVRNFKSQPAARTRLLDWLAAAGLTGVALRNEPEDHYVASCAAALGAWKNVVGEPAWIEPAQPPAHPFDYVA